MHRRVDGVGRSPSSRGRGHGGKCRIDGTSQSKGYYTGVGKCVDLVAGAGDGRRARDGAGRRRRLAAAPSLNLGVTGHGVTARRPKT